MALWSERQRRAGIELREAAGEDLWTVQLDLQLRTKLWALVDECARTERGRSTVEAQVRRIVRINVGLADPPLIYDVFIGSHKADTGLALTYIDAIDAALQIAKKVLATEGWSQAAQNISPTAWRKAVPDVLRSHRAKYKFIDGEIFPLESEEMHVAVVEPVVYLLRGRADFEKVNAAYRSALKEIAYGSAGDAITDAGTALQEALSALGCAGNALGPLIADARRKGLLAPHDGTLASGVQKFLDWVSADRSQTGDAHSVDAAVLDDAWLAVHVVGALILRLAGSPRGTAP